MLAAFSVFTKYARRWEEEGKEKGTGGDAA
jgi:hypothetical protein